MKINRWMLPLLGVLGLLTFAAVGEALPRFGIVREDDLPPTSIVLTRLIEMLGTADVWRAIGDTVVVWALGLTIATAAAIILGFLLGLFAPLRAATASTVEFLRPIPSVALIPLVVLLFGPRYESGLVLVIYAAFWQVLVQMMYGVTDTDPVADETARSYHFSIWGRIRHVLWPTALPYLMTGFRLAATVALVLTVTAQLLIGTPGLGQLITLSESSGQVPTTYALVLITGLMGVLVNLGVRWVEGRLLAWHPSIRAEVL